MHRAYRRGQHASEMLRNESTQYKVTELSGSRERGKKSKCDGNHSWPRAEAVSYFQRQCNTEVVGA